MYQISVRTAATTGNSPIGEMLTFDFTADIQAGSQILAYGVGMAGFSMNYITDSSAWAENMGLLQVSLIPNQVGGVICATGNCIMTDYDGDAAQAPTVDGSSPATMVQATAIALIGTSNSDQVISNVYGIGNATNTPSINVGTNSVSEAFLAGFRLAASGSPGSLNSISIGTDITLPSNQQISVGSRATTTGVEVTGSIDALILSATPSITSFQIVPATIRWNSPDGQSGMTTSYLSATFDQMPDAGSISYAGILLRSVNISYSDDEEFQLVAAQQVGSLNISGNQVSGTYLLNIFNPDIGARTYIDSSSTAEIYIIAQFSASGE